MGPRSGERGKATKRDRYGDPYTLQWGRALVNAESGQAPAVGVDQRSASMGPRSGERGKGADKCEVGLDHIASMGPRSGERGKGL